MIEHRTTKVVEEKTFIPGNKIWYEDICAKQGTAKGILRISTKQFYRMEFMRDVGFQVKMLYWEQIEGPLESGLEVWVLPHPLRPREDLCFH